MERFASVHVLSQGSLFDSLCNKWRSNLWLCICELVVLIYSPTGRQQPLPQNTTCSSLLCPLLLTRGSWEAFSFKNLQTINKTPMEAGHQLSLLRIVISSQLRGKYLFHAWLNQIIKGFPGTNSVDANSSNKLWFNCPRLGILPCLGISKI